MTTYTNGGRLSLMVIIIGNGIDISLDANTIGKGMNPSVLPSARDKVSDKLDSLASVRQPV